MKILIKNLSTVYGLQGTELKQSKRKKLLLSVWKFSTSEGVGLQWYRVLFSCSMVSGPSFIIRNYLKSYAHTNAIKGLPTAIGRVLIVQNIKQNLCI